MALALALAPALWGETAGATLRFAPLFLDLDAAGPGAQASVRLDNDRDRPAAVEAVALRRSATGPGTPAEGTSETPSDDFAVFPPQALIPPGSAQVFRIRYVGDPTIPASVPYHLAFRELPLRLEPAAGGASGARGGALSLLLDIRVDTHVSPPGARALPRVSAAAPARGPEGPALAFTVQNAGARYAAISDYRLVLADETGRVLGDLPGEALLAGHDSTVVPAGGERRFTLALPAALAAARQITLGDVPAR